MRLLRGAGFGECVLPLGPKYFAFAFAVYEYTDYNIRNYNDNNININKHHFGTPRTLW